MYRIWGQLINIYYLHTKLQYGHNFHIFNLNVEVVDINLLTQNSKHTLFISTKFTKKKARKNIHNKLRFEFSKKYIDNAHN